MPDKTAIPAAAQTIEEMRQVLAEAGLALASFRWRLRENGFPFAEPPNLSGTIARIDALVFPDAGSSATKKQRAAQCQVTR